MQSDNMPIEMISMCNVVGEIVPLKMRIEDETHQLITASIIKVLYKKENQYAGIKTLDYGCKVLMEERQRIIELRYEVSNHRWLIKEILA